MNKNRLLTCFAVIFICITDISGLNRRLDQALQNANLDFLSFEGNRQPAAPVPKNPTQQNVDPKSAQTSTSTVASTTKPTTPGSAVKQLINKFNDRTDGERPVPVRPNPTAVNSNVNRQSSTGINTNTQQNANSGPTVPTKPVPGSPLSGNQKPLSVPTGGQAAAPSREAFFGLPASSGTTSPQPGNAWNKNPSVVGQPGTANKEGFPSLPSTGSPAIPTKPLSGGPWGGSQKPTPTAAVGQPNKEAFPGLPGASGAVGAPAATPKPISWSSVVSGNKPSGPGSPPSSISPENLPKTAQNLRPINIGDDRPSTPTGSPQPTASGAAKELASDAELKDISEALLKKDTNNAAKYITVNYQGKTSSFSKDDLAPQPLLAVQPAVWNIPTVAAMKVLLDNYEQDVTVNEHITPLEKNEENEFLDAIMATSVIRHLMTFLKDKGVVSQDPRQQRDILKQIWFNIYSRGQGKIGSSGFEHIFVSELKNGEISGLHNWIYFQNEEAANRTNYLGYLKKVELADKGAILKLHFNMKGIDKPVDTMFIGTSPELEVALYSLCFLTRVDRACPLSLAGQNFNLRTHNYRYRSKNMIGSGFPEI